MYKYSITIYWSETDKLFIAEAPDLPGCMAHGNTEAEALAKCKEAMELWINTAKEFGDPIPKPSGQLSKSV